MKPILERLRLLPAARWLWHLPKLITDPEFRRLESERRERSGRTRFVAFRRLYGDVLRYPLYDQKGQLKRALVVSSGFGHGLVEGELVLIKALELAGYVPIVVLGASLVGDDQAALLMDYYGLVSPKKVLHWHDFCPPPDFTAAEAVIAKCPSVQDLLALEYDGARVGRYVASTAMRRLRSGSLDMQSPHHQRALVDLLASAIPSVTAARRVLREVRPELLLLMEWVYTPAGELYDICVTNGTEAITWHPAHKSNSLMLKRYTLENRDEHPVSLSPESWRLLRNTDWTDARRAELHQELYGAYAANDWYSVSGTQFNKRLVDAEKLRGRLGLDPAKKTACICTHIPWDASFLSGQDLFRDYEQWLIETVRAACANDHVNWVVKIHPAHVGKGVKEGYQGEPAEAIALREQIGELPPHVFVILADSDISTFSLFALMDYCLTVRGTIGVEAASFGIPVLTAGTGRYDRKGFTIDSDSREQYLERVLRIQEIPQLSPAQRELAQRFAYGIFVLRPLPLSTFTIRFAETYYSGSSKTEITIRARQEWYDAPDLKAFAQWVTDSTETDFMMPLPGRGAEPSANRSPR